MLSARKLVVLFGACLAWVTASGTAFAQDTKPALDSQPAAKTGAAVTATPPLTFKLSDSAVPVHAATVDLSMSIASGPLTITTTSLPNGSVGTAYSQTLTATGGNGAHTWQLTAGTLPNGLTLNASTGLIGGTPTNQVNATPLTFLATDSGSPA